MSLWLGSEGIRRLHVLGAFNVSLVVLVDHVNPEPLVDVQEVVVDIRQRLVVLLEGLEQHRLGLEQLPGHNGIRHALQHEPPRSGV